VVRANVNADWSAAREDGWSRTRASIPVQQPIDECRGVRFEPLLNPAESGLVVPANGARGVREADAKEDNE
jgi:hypothetical protein